MGVGGRQGEILFYAARPAALRTQPRRAGGLSGREGLPDVVPGNGAAQEVELGRIRCRGLIIVIGYSGHGGGSRGYVRGRRSAVFHLRAGDIYGRRERVYLCYVRGRGHH
jgi:hypothetical protein